MSRTSPLGRALNALMVLAMLVVGTLAVDRAAAHAAVAAGHAMQPPCHRLRQADGLALTPVNACDTICAGSAPETSYDALPVRLDVVVPVLNGEAPVIPAPARTVEVSALHYGHGPPPLPPFLRDRRLLI